MFCKGIKKDLLIAFIKVRDNEDITASTEHFPKLKGKMDDLEKDPTYFCLVLKAFSVQSNPVIAREDTIPTFDIDGTNPEEDNNNDTDNTTDDETSWSVTSDYVRKSCILFATLCNKEADFAENAATARNVDTLKNNILSKVLYARLGAHLKKHALESKHYTVNFIRKNMERAVTIMKLHGFYQRDRRLENVGHKDSLFKKDMDFGDSFNHGEVNPNSHFENKIGVYLMKDCESRDMIRAGSATTSFGVRLREHLKSSKLKRDSDKKSKLYSSYPHEKASEKDKRGSISVGRWDDIRSYIGIGWEWEKNKEIIDLFEWDSTTMCGLKNNKNPSSIEKKQERMMVYLFELLLSISLEPSKNISSSPGFETFNGSFAR